MSDKPTPSRSQTGKAANPRKPRRAKQIKAWSKAKPNPLAPQLAQDPEGQRGHKRVAVFGLTCRLGDVVDLSARGMGVVGRGKPDMQVGEVGVMGLQCPIADEPVWAWVLCVTREKQGRRKIRYGLRIIDKTRDTRDKLTRLMSLTRQAGETLHLEAA